MLRFGILGPLEVWENDQGLTIGGPQQHALLAVLLLNANRVVSADRLVDHLWGEQPPPTARSLLQGCVAGLRRALRVGRGERLLTRPPGYLLEVRPGELDLDRFEELAAAGQPAEALALWRGPAFDGITVDACQAEAARLEERRLAVLSDRIDADLRRGRYADLVAELQILVRDHPLRERLWAQLVLALHGADRQADALAAYQEIRRTLIDQLGVEPGAALQQAQRVVLSSQRPDPPVQAPAQLPARPAAFTGREQHLKRLDEMLAENAIAVVSGTAGVGKTTLAVHYAHQVRSRFPDGQLYVNLSGYAPTPSMRPIEALSGFLLALGVPAEQVPVEPEQAAALYRTLVSGRRMLIVLDNARTVEQVRPLLPGGPGCLVLVTSRDTLGGLVAREGAGHLTLDVLDPAEAETLLARVLGDDRVGAEPHAAAELAGACAYLPLALRIAAANLTVRPRRRIAEHVAELAAEGRLAALAVEGDDHSAVRVAFDHSYATLTPPRRRLFRLLGLVPGADFTVDAAAALAGVSPPDARRLLEALADAHLVEQHATGRYAFHDLLRRYAAECVHSGEDAQGLYDWYLHSALAAADLLYPHMLRLPYPAPGTAFRAHADALAWLEAERHNLVAAVRHGPFPFSCLLADALRGYFHLRRYMPDWFQVGLSALDAARAAGDPWAETAAQHSLGTAYRSMGEYQRALRRYGDALRLSRRSGWREAEATTLGNLGIVCRALGRLDQAARHLDRALAIDRTTGRRAGEANNLGNLADVYHHMGRLDEAAAHFTRAMELNRLSGTRHGEALALTGLGDVLRELGRPDEAAKALAEALSLYLQVGDRDGQAIAEAGLATVECALGRPEQGRRYAQAALVRARETNDPRTEATALNALGTAQRRLGRPAEAVESHQRAYRLAEQTATRRIQIESLIGLAHAHRSLGALGDAAGYAGRAEAAAGSGGYRVLEREARAVSRYT